MKVAVILGLFIAIVSADKKINLEDIERDNLRAESKSGTENINSQETSYSVPPKAEKVKPKYQPGTRQYENDHDDIPGYVTSQQLQGKYAARSEDYQQDIKYLNNNGDYQQLSQPIQFVEYPQRVETAVPKSLPQASTYETPQQQLYYQPEVSVGNHYQSVQQRTAGQKFIKNSNKDTFYVNIPMAQLLSYYPHMAGAPALIPKAQGHPGLDRLTNQPNQEVIIPFFMVPSSRDRIYSNSKTTYEIPPQYTSHSSRYPLLTEAILPTRQPSKLIYSQSLLHQRQPQPQAHYLQEIVYTQQQPSTLTYVPITSSHDSSLYDRPSSAHLDSNTINQNYASQTRHEQTYAPYDHQSATKYEISHGNYAPHSTNQIYQQPSTENVQEDYENIPGAPDSGLDLPRLPAKNFKSSDSHYTQNQLVHSEEPRSLLESYIPSNILAAQNSERYRERPIRLERGFLPSKVNYVQSYKKRKVE